MSDSHIVDIGYARAVYVPDTMPLQESMLKKPAKDLVILAAKAIGYDEIAQWDDKLDGFTDYEQFSFAPQRNFDDSFSMMVHLGIQVAPDKLRKKTYAQIDEACFSIEWKDLGCEQATLNAVLLAAAFCGLRKSRGK